MKVTVCVESDCPPDLLAAIERALRAFLGHGCGKAPPRPAAISVSGPQVEVSMIRYPFTMPPLPDVEDLATREVSYAINDTDPLVESHAPEETTWTHDFEVGDHVIMTLRDVDTSGNKSLPSEPLSFTAAAPDTTPPPQPGVITAGTPEEVLAAAKKKHR